MKDVFATYVTVELQINRDLTMTVDEFHERAISLTDQLMCQEEVDELVTDTTVSSDAAEYQVTVEMLVYTDEAMTAINHTSAFIRTALHALGESTPGWPNAEQIAEALQETNVQTERTLVSA